MQIHWRNPKGVGDDDRAAAEERIEALARDHSDLIDVWIDVEKPSNHHRQRPLEVTIRGEVRGGEVVVHGKEEQAATALRRAVQSFERDLKRRRNRLQDRRVERPPEPPALGVVDRVLVDEGYGFLLTDAGEQVYFHRNAVQGGLEFGALEEGQRVALAVEPGEKGPQATFVAPAPPDAPRP